MFKLIIYTTDGCHLCEHAADLLKQIGLNRELEIVAVDISEDEGLVEQYGIRIPVLLNEAKGIEIGWPFDAADILTLLD